MIPPPETIQAQPQVEGNTANVCWEGLALRRKKMTAAAGLVRRLS
jgi:hypothetical protein